LALMERPRLRENRFCTARMFSGVLLHQTQAPTQQVAHGALGLRVDISLRQ